MNHNHSNADGMKHFLLMLACCLIPIAVIVAIGVFGLSLGSLGGLLPYAMVLICPLMMFLMMRGMMGGQSHAEHHEVARAASSPARPETAGAPVGAEQDPPRCH